MNEKTQYVRVNRYTRPGIKNYGVRGVVWHYTASQGATAQNERDYFDGTCITSKRYASAHDFIDSKQVVHIIPHNEIAYHAHDQNRCMVNKLDPNANYTSIGVELCIDKKGNLEKATYDNAVEYGAALCKQYKLNPLTDFFRHYDVTCKNCPAFWVSNPKGFEQFKQDVYNKLHPKVVKTVEGPFKDVSGDRWSAKAIENLKAKGIFHGRSDGTFAPGDNITREEVAAVIDNLLKYLGK